VFERTYRSSAECKWQALSNSYISVTLSGLDGTLRKAKSRVQPHQPEVARCSECLSAETSKTMYVVVLTLTVAPATVYSASTTARSSTSRVLMMVRLLPSRRVVLERSSLQLPRPKMRR